jgi:hypothetical protein
METDSSKEAQPARSKMMAFRDHMIIWAVSSVLLTLALMVMRALGFGSLRSC